MNTSQFTTYYVTELVTSCELNYDIFTSRKSQTFLLGTTLLIVCVYDALGFFFYMMNELSHFGDTDNKLLLNIVSNH